MANLRELIFNLKQEPHGCITTAIGEICVFCITGGGEEKLYKELGKSISECEPMDFVKKFIRHICFPKSSLKEGKYKPEKPLLTNEDISSLTKDDIEAIAKLYVEKSEYLFKKLVWKTKTDDEGKLVQYSEYGEIEYPQNQNENYVQYLTRLYIKEEEKRKKQMETILSKIKVFSNPLENSIKSMLALGESLKKTVESVQPVHAIPMKPVEPKFPKIDFAAIEESRLRPFNELSERLDQLIGVSAQGIEFMAEANKIQTSIATEIKSSGDETKKFSEKNICLTCVVIGLTIINLAVFGYSIWRSNNDGDKQRVEIQKNVNLLAGKLTDINNSIVMNESLKTENESLKKQISEQAKSIDEMKNLIRRQDKELEDIEKKITATHPQN